MEACALQYYVNVHVEHTATALINMPTATLLTCGYKHSNYALMARDRRKGR